MKSIPDPLSSIRFHLVTTASRGKPLCGEASPDAAIGSYVEHLDPTNGAARWVREVLDGNGSTVTGCAACLARYPAVLL